MTNQSKTTVTSTEGTFPTLENCTVAIIGLGYVGLPLALSFALAEYDLRNNLPLHRRIIGFDIDRQRINDLLQGIDRTYETEAVKLETAKRLTLTCDEEDLTKADVFIVTVPTPIDDSKRPDLSPLKNASEMIGKAIAERAKVKDTNPLVIFESTVYPGATEEICVPIMEDISGLEYNNSELRSGFYCGYSPERINPGDKEHKLTTIVKVTSGSNSQAAAWIDRLYGSIISAGTYLASSIKVAEAAKVIENTQRDLNIALVNELALIFERIGIDTLDVLEAAGTKWNFLPFRPGLVGGHCIGVDPLYLTHKAEQLGYYPQVVLAGRRINDGMAQWLAQRLLREMASRAMLISGSQVLMLGVSFKENCPDLRNSRVIDMIRDLEKCGCKVTIVDPWVDTAIALKREGIRVVTEIPENVRYEGIVLAVAHNQFVGWSISKWHELMSINAVVMDLKGLIPRDLEPIRL